MRLTRFKVENHRRLADLDIEVRDHLVLVGANDVGKSSLLRCLVCCSGRVRRSSTPVFRPTISEPPTNRS